MVKAKSLTTEETGLNEALEERGIRPWETDLAQLIIQLSDDAPSHILVPAIHKNREQIRALFARTLPDAPPDLSDDPRELAETARAHLRKLFLQARVGISGVNFAVAETGTVSIVESEGNGRMCTTLPEVLDLRHGHREGHPHVGGPRGLPPAAAALVHRRADEPLHVALDRGDAGRRARSEFHLILLDNGRTKVLADAIGRQALNCIRCGACLNVCPVYERTGGHAYGSVYPGPIGAILTPHARGRRERARSLPYASSLCGACYEVCPVKINIPEVLVHLRQEEVAQASRASSLRERLNPEHVAMKAMARPAR